MKTPKKTTKLQTCNQKKKTKKNMETNIKNFRKMKVTQQRFFFPVHSNTHACTHARVNSIQDEN